MNLNEYVDMVVADELSEDAMEKKWKRFCYILSCLSVDEISEMIHDGFLDSFIEYESMDGFGTEGMHL